MDVCSIKALIINFEEICHAILIREVFSNHETERLEALQVLPQWCVHSALNTRWLYVIKIVPKR